jgi:hypothetical protein
MILGVKFSALLFVFQATSRCRCRVRPTAAAARCTVSRCTLSFPGSRSLSSCAYVHKLQHLKQTCGLVFKGLPCSNKGDLDLLKSFADDPALSLRERALKLAMPGSSLQRKIEGLLKRKFIEQGADEKYRLTTKGRKELLTDLVPPTPEQ